MKLKRIDLLNLDYVLKSAIFDQPICGRFRYMLTSNLKVIGTEIEEINSAFPAPEAFVEFQQAEGKVYQECGVKTITDIDALEDEKKAELDSKLDAVRDEYAEAIDEMNAIQEEKNGFIGEEVEIDLKEIKVSDVPVISDKNEHDHWEIWSILSKIVVDD